MRKAVIIVAMLMVLVAVWVSRQEDSVGMFQPSAEEQVADRDETVRFVERAPVTRTRPSKALLVFHGGGGSAERVETQTDFTELARSHGFLVVYPDANGNQWNDHRPQTDGFGDDVSQVRAYIESLRSEGVREVYVTGISNGGMFSYRLACELSDIIDGFAPVAANLPAGVVDCEPERARPMLVQQGTADPLMKYDGGDIFASERFNLGVGGTVLSASDTLDFWVDAYECSTLPTELPFDENDADRITVTRFDWGSCRDGARIVQLRYEGGGHTWYGSGEGLIGEQLVGPAGTDVSATRQIVSFFGLDRK